MKNDLLVQVLETRKAKCLLPLIEMIGDLDGLIEDGFKNFSDDIPKKIKKFQHELNDIDHILEDSYDVLDDSQLIRYSKRRGEVRRERRFKKNEGVFLSRDGVEALLLNFTKLLTEATKSVTETESQVYLTRVLDAPECSTKVVSSNQNKKPIPAELVTPEVKLIETKTVDSTNETVLEKREYDISDIQNSPKDSMIVKEGISDYRNVIVADTDFDISKLMDNWKDMFAGADATYKKETLLEAYVSYYSNPKNIMEKAIGDFAVWNHLLPKILLNAEYYTK